MIWRIVSRLAELGGLTLSVTPSAIYAAIDGLFQNYLLKHLTGDLQAIPNMQADVRLVMTRITSGTAG
jgi:hypothetical protein